MKKGIFEKIMSDLETRDFVALRTSCSKNELDEKDTGKIFHETFYKIDTRHS